MLWFLISVLGFLVATAVVTAMARSDTARWERAKVARARGSVHRPPAGSVPPHARRRRVQSVSGPRPLPVRTGLPNPRVPDPAEARPVQDAP